MRCASRPNDKDRLAEFLHAISQPLTVLECGLELSLHHEKHPNASRVRLQGALASVRILHRQVDEFRRRNLLAADSNGRARTPNKKNS